MHDASSRQIITAAVQSGNFVLAAKSCVRLAEKLQHDPELWLMAAQLSDHAGLTEKAASCYGVVARLYARKEQVDQATRMFRHYADHHHTEDEQQLCRCLFNACREFPPTVCEQEDPVCQILREHPMWTTLSAPQVARLLKGCRVRQYARGDCLAKEGEEARRLFLLASGVVRSDIQCQQHEQGGFRITPGELCGDCAFHLGLNQHVCSLFAEQDCVVVEIPFRLMRALMNGDDGFRQHVTDLFEQHILLDMLQNIPWFSGLEQHVLQGIGAEMHWQACSAGQTLFTQGETGELGMYIIKSGWMSINYRWHEREYHLCTLKAGDVFGELGLLQNRRQITVRAVVDCELLHWEESDFRPAYEQYYSLRDGSKASFTRYQRAMENIRQGAENPYATLSQVDHDSLLKEMCCQRLLASGQ